MSKKGVKVAADVFNEMQKARVELFQIGCQTHNGPIDRQDVLLARLLEDMNDFAKDRFCQIVSGTHFALEKRP